MGGINYILVFASSIFFVVSTHTDEWLCGSNLEVIDEMSSVLVSVL